MKEAGKFRPGMTLQKKNNIIHVTRMFSILCSSVGKKVLLNLSGSTDKSIFWKSFFRVTITVKRGKFALFSTTFTCTVTLAKEKKNLVIKSLV